MSSGVPVGARPVARVLVVSTKGRVLLLEAREPSTSHAWWMAPGGGLLVDESFRAAAARELREETGLTCAIGPWVWTRRHVYDWEGRRHDQYERFFVTAERVEESAIRPIEPDGYVVGHRWWSREEIQSSRDDFAPNRMGELMPPILSGQLPRPPIDCGV